MKEYDKECKKVQELFGAYIYNSATPSERADVEKHISYCKKCAADLFSRQKVLIKFKVSKEMSDMSQTAQDKFAINVYKKIAMDSLKHYSRQALLRKFVLQPSLALIIIAVSITAFFLRFHPGQMPTIAKEPVSVASKIETINANESSKKESRADLYVKEFYTRQNTDNKEKPRTDELVNIPEGKTNIPENSPLTSDKVAMEEATLTSGPKSMLEEANFLNFSLGDKKRAMAQYQKLVDNYPDSVAAEVAWEMIKSIRSSEYRVQNETSISVQTVDMEM